MAMKRNNMLVGVSLAVAFLVVLWVMFMKLYPEPNGTKVNAFTYSDNLFNSMAKGSTYHIPSLVKKVEKLKGKTFEMTLEFHDGALSKDYQIVGADLARDAAMLLGSVAQATANGNELTVSGDLSAVLGEALKDSDDMFHNDGAAVSGRYNLDERRVMIVWWKVLSEMRRQFTLAKNKPMSDMVKSVVNKGVEVGYNFYGIAPESVSERAGILTFALVFYVVYTLWWGIAIMEIFTGLGLKITKGAKKEV